MDIRSLWYWIVNYLFYSLILLHGWYKKTGTLGMSAYGWTSSRPNIMHSDYAYNIPKLPWLDFMIAYAWTILDYYLIRFWQHAYARDSYFWYRLFWVMNLWPHSQCSNKKTGIGRSKNKRKPQHNRRGFYYIEAILISFLSKMKSSSIELCKATAIILANLNEGLYVHFSMKTIVSLLTQTR